METDRIESIQAKLKLKEELIDSLKNTSAATRRLTAWHEKISKLQLEDLALQRELVRIKQANDVAERELKASFAKVTQLEEELISTKV
jgi:hypothetical protein